MTRVYNPNSHRGPEMGFSTQQDQHYLFLILEFHNVFQPCQLSVQHLSLYCQSLYLSSHNEFFLNQGASHEREVLVSGSIVCCCFSHCPLPSTLMLPPVNRQMAGGMDGPPKRLNYSTEKAFKVRTTLNEHC